MSKYYIDKESAIGALEAIRYGLWEIDIPSPTVPEYVEHHEQIKNMIEITDGWIKKLEEQSTADVVERSTYDQVRWERDTAIAQLASIGKGFGEKMDDVVKRKKGKWLIRDNPGTGWYRGTCSECGEDVTSEIPVIGFFPDVKPIWDFCPYCGADMRGEQNDQ